MNERGAWTFGPIVGTIIVVLAIIGFFAVCTDDPDEDDFDSLGRVELVSHDYGGGYGDGDDNSQEYEDNWGGEDRNRNRGRNRGAFSPGPFDDSPVDAFNNACLPGATCYYDGRQPEDESEEAQP